MIFSPELCVDRLDRPDQGVVTGVDLVTAGIEQPVPEGLPEENDVSLGLDDDQSRDLPRA